MQTDPGAQDGRRFYEPGGRWRYIAFGPVLCAVVMIVELLTGPTVHWLALGLCAVILAGFTALQITAARSHASVELTDTTLRQGAETVNLTDIARIFPPAVYEKGDFEPKRWELARALGELPAVPRKRRGIGMKMRDGKLVQAWARDDDALRAELEAAMQRQEKADE